MFECPPVRFARSEVSTEGADTLPIALRLADDKSAPPRRLCASPPLDLCRPPGSDCDCARHLSDDCAQTTHFARGEMLHAQCVKGAQFLLVNTLSVPKLIILKVNWQTRVEQVQGKDSTMSYRKICKAFIRLEPSETQRWTSRSQPLYRTNSHPGTEPFLTCRCCRPLPWPELLTFMPRTRLYSSSDGT